jgi:hypothetical protein
MIQDSGDFWDMIFLVYAPPGLRVQGIVSMIQDSGDLWKGLIFLVYAPSSAAPKCSKSTSPP